LNLVVFATGTGCGGAEKQETAGNNRGRGSDQILEFVEADVASKRFQRGGKMIEEIAF